MIQEFIKGFLILLLANLAALANWFFFKRMRYSIKEYLFGLIVIDLLFLIGWLLINLTDL